VEAAEAALCHGVEPREQLPLLRRGGLAVGLPVGGPAAEAAAEPEKGYEYGAIFNLDDLIINPKNSVGRRLFKISLALEYDPVNAALAAELGQRTPYMRDYLISYLGSMSEDSLSDISYREVIRDSLSVALNRFLKDGRVDRVLFQDFIRQ